METVVEAVRELKMSLNVLPKQISSIRHTAMEHLTACGCEAIATDAALVITELLSNVYKHAHGRCVLRICPWGDELFITVSDTVMDLPRIAGLSSSAEEGRGMHLISRLTDHWEAVTTKTGKDVKCRMAMPDRGQP